MTFIGTTPGITETDSGTEPMAGASVTLGSSATLASLMAALTPAVAFPANMRRLTLVVRSGGTGYYQVGGAASSATPQIPAGGLSRPCQAITANTLYVQGSGTLDVHIDG